MDLDFRPLGHWPSGLPAVAVNKWILAGFGQSLVFNHECHADDPQCFFELFCSLYNELSFSELARLWKKSSELPWFPMKQIAGHYRVHLGSQFEDVSDALLLMPMEFQNWCAQKKFHQGDLLPLLAVHHLQHLDQGLENFQKLIQTIVALSCTKSQGVQALEWGLELLMMKFKWQELSPFPEMQSVEAWLAHLKELRFPETKERDESAAIKILKLPWPGSSQVKWVRQGDQPGIELKLFVTKPSDLKKYAASLKEVMEHLGDSEESPWLKH